MADTLREKYLRGTEIPDHFRHQDQLIACARSLGVELSAAVDLWRAFTLWRIEAVAAHATASVDDADGNYDFG